VAGATRDGTGSSRTRFRGCMQSMVPKWFVRPTLSAFGADMLEHRLALGPYCTFRVPCASYVSSSLSRSFDRGVEDCSCTFSRRWYSRSTGVLRRALLADMLESETVHLQPFLDAADDLFVDWIVDVVALLSSDRSGRLASSEMPANDGNSVTFRRAVPYWSTPAFG